MNNNSAIRFRFCTVHIDHDAERVTTTFADGTKAYACPHQTPEYRQHAIDKGCGKDVWRYCIEHDLAHILVGEAQDKPSKVLWALAHGESTEGTEFDLEEQAAQHLHRFMNRSGWPAKISARCIWETSVA